MTPRPSWRAWKPANCFRRSPASCAAGQGRPGWGLRTGLRGPARGRGETSGSGVGVFGIRHLWDGPGRPRAGHTARLASARAWAGRSDADRCRPGFQGLGLRPPRATYGLEVRHALGGPTSDRTRSGPGTGGNSLGAVPEPENPVVASATPKSRPDRHGGNPRPAGTAV